LSQGSAIAALVCLLQGAQDVPPEAGRVILGAFEREPGKG
jgi:hypothetical protein